MKGKIRINSGWRRWILGAVVTGLFCLYTLPVRAENDLGGAVTEQAVNAYIDRFVKFLGDKNVMGRVKKPDGSAAKAAKGKTHFNADDGGPFQSDLTYHDNSYNDIEEEKQAGKKGPDGKEETKETVLFSFISPHGKFSGAGGSSLLERTAYDLHKQFAKAEDAGKAKQDDEKQGIKYRDAFKIETQEVFKNNKAAPGQGQGGQPGQAQAQAGKNDKKEEPDKVERFTLREEARPQVDKVGSETSFQTVQRAARDQGFEDDPKTMANPTMLYEAAGRAAQTMWNSTLANLSQRRFFKGIKAGILGETPKINEDRPTVDKWATEIQGAIGKAAKGDQNLQKALGEDLNRMRKQATQLSGVQWSKIDPRFEADEKAQGGGAGGGEPPETLKFLGPQKEDAFQRDMRVQLSVLDKAGAKVGSIPSNWKYTAKDEQTQLINYDDSGQESGKRNVTVQDQLKGYNQQLQDAAKGMDEIKTRFPGYKGDSAVTLGYQIAPNTRSVMDIDRPTQSMMEEFGMGGAPQAPRMSQTYDELLKSGGDPK